MSGYAMCLIDGKVQEYYAASQVGKGGSYNPSFFSYIGDGYIESIGGKPMWGDELLSFYVLRPGRPRSAR